MSLADARRQAEEALAIARTAATWEEVENALTVALRALLAATAPAPQPEDVGGWAVVQGDQARRLHPDGRERLNGSGAWVVGPFHRSWREAERDIPAPPAGDGVRELLRRCDEVLSWIKFEDGVPTEWPEEAVVATVRARIERTLLAALDAAKGGTR